MKQLLLRVPDDVHRRLTERAAESRRSVNSLATTILDDAVGEQTMDRRTRLRARAAALGMLVPTEPVARRTPAERQSTLQSTRGPGPVVDAIIDEDRDRR